MGTPVVHFEILGGKGSQLEKFYAGLFGWRIDSNNPMQYGMVDTCAREGINGAVGPSHDGGKRLSVYLRVEDLAATLARVEELGGKVVLPPSQVPGGPKLAMFADPAGNLTGLLAGKQAAE